MAGNRAVGSLQRDATKPPSTTLYVGMNPAAAKKEAAPLKRLLGKQLEVSVDDQGLEKTLATDDGMMKWVGSILPPGFRSIPQALRIIVLLKSFPTSTRDSLAPVIVTFDKAERGLITLERLILSGHSNGVGLWGDPTNDKRMGGRFVLDKDLKRIADVFPGAAGQVQDVMFSACFSIGAIGHVRAAFPNVQTVWGYEAFSPKAGKGSLGHVKQWEKATRGDRKLTKIAGRGSSSLWNENGTKDGEFVRNDPGRVDPKTIYGSITYYNPELERQFRGSEALQREFLAMYYGIVQRGLAHPRVGSSERGIFEMLRDVVLRLRFWPQIAEKYGAKHSAAIAAGYAKAGRPVPDFSRLSRAVLKAEMDALTALTDSNPSASALHTLYTPLWSLRDTTAIPETWIG